jgi:hypothetical protein
MALELCRRNQRREKWELEKMREERRKRNMKVIEEK